MVTLQAVEDDGLDEELQVIWELEPGAGVYERATPPDPRQGFDDPKRLDAFLDAVRWGAVASADVSQLNAPFCCGITIEDYQLDSVVRALPMPCANLLIADDVGLGKTIEAGLILRELLMRQKVRRVLIACPPSVVGQLQEEMEQRFGLLFVIYGRAFVAAKRQERSYGTADTLRRR